MGVGDDVPKSSNRDIREAMLALDRAVTTQVILNMVPKVNVVERTMTSRWRSFPRFPRWSVQGVECYGSYI